MDIVTELIGFPHILTDIFSAVSYETLVAAEKVSLSWKNILSLPSIWRTRLRKVSPTPTWKILSSRMEHRQPELKNRIKEEDSSAYQEAVNYFERNIGFKISEFSNFRIFHKASFLDGILQWEWALNCFKVDHRYIYMGFSQGNIRIINRWTWECIKNIDRPHVSGYLLKGLQLSERHLATKFSSGLTVIYDLATFQQTQILPEDFYQYTGFETERFCITSDILVDLKLRSANAARAFLSVWKFNHETGLFGSEVRSEEFSYNCPNAYNLNAKVFCCEKYIIVVDAIGYKKLIRAFDMKSLNVVRQRTFEVSRNISIKEQCHDGMIFYIEENCLVTWNVETDIVQPIAEHSSFPTSDGDVYLAAMDHYPDYQFRISKSNGKMNFAIFKIEGRQCIENCSLIKVQSKIFDDKYSTIMMNILEKFDFHSSKQSCYFDGVQLIFIGRDGLHLLEFDV